MLSVERVTKQYPSPQGPLTVLNELDLTLAPGEAAAVMGPSGSGKSTLLYIIGALERPTSGRVLLDGQDYLAFAEAEAARFRNRTIGFVFQDHCLLPQLSLLENVLTPTLVGEPADGAAARARELLERVGLGQRLDHKPGELSGGEKQRAAIARALIRGPRLLLCDEPTGNLDRHSADGVADLLLGIHADQRTILVVVTHSHELAAKLPARYELVDGRLVRQ